jgi:acetate kinase
MPEGEVRVKGLIEKIGLNDGGIWLSFPSGNKKEYSAVIRDHTEGIRLIQDILTDPSNGLLTGIGEIDAVGHRVVHAGEYFSGSVLITSKVIEALEVCTDLAPLHNPPNLAGIRAISGQLPHLPQAGVFDTAFHQTIPEHAYLYGIPHSLYEKYKIRRYGFHGTSHQFVSQRACDMLGVDVNDMRIISCHLGNGSSITAIKEGVSVDTSMGMTPIEGLIMGTRCGDIDAGVLLYLAEKEHLSISQTSDLLNKKSGMLGISGISSDMRDVELAADKGHKMAEIALDMFAYRVKKYIGAYAAAMDGLDLVVFTGGIGENDAETRERILTGMTFLGIVPDRDKNRETKGKEGMISARNSKVKVLVVPTNEEFVIASETYRLVRTNGW